MKIIITGASRGIGYGLAKCYHTKGHEVIGISRTPPESLSHFTSYYYVDLLQSSAVSDVLDQIRREHSTVYALINNAGGGIMNSALMTGPDKVDEIMQLNFRATAQMSRGVARLMLPKKVGRIVNFSSMAARGRTMGEAIYGASKAAIETYTKTASYTFARFGVTMNAIAPGLVDTDLIADLPEENVDAIIKKQPIQRYGTIRDIENVIDFFLHKDSGMVTGQIVSLGGPA